MNACIPVMKPFIQVPTALRGSRRPSMRLAYGQLFSRFLGASEILRFRVVSGHLWITMEGRREDYHLGAGENLSIEGPGRLVAEGIEDGAVVEIA